MVTANTGVNQAKTQRTYYSAVDDGRPTSTNAAFAEENIVAHEGIFTEGEWTRFGIRTELDLRYSAEQVEAIEKGQTSLSRGHVSVGRETTTRERVQHTMPAVTGSARTESWTKHAFHKQG